MKKIINYLKKYLAIVAGVILAMLFYLIDAVICLSTSDHGSVATHLLSTTPEDIFHRFVVTSMFILFGVVVHILMIRRKAAEAKGANSQIKYQSLFSSMLNGFAWHKIIVDENGHPVDYEYLEVNNAFEKLTGLNRKDVLLKRVSEVIPDLKNDDFDWIGTYGRVALNNEKIQFEQYSKALGKWYNITAYSPAKGEFATVFEDISERKKIERVVRENQERMDTILNSIQAGIMVIDRETHTIAYVNEAAVKMIGSTREQLLDQHCQKHVCPADFGACPITDKGQKVDNSERVLLTADGRKLPILKTVVEAELDGRQVLVESFVDISERKLAEQALRESEEKYKNLSENLKELVYRADPATWKTTYINKAVKNIYGYTAEEWYKDPKLWENSIYPDDKERVFVEFAEAQKKPDSSIIAYRIIKKDKTVSWLEDRIVCEKDQQGNVVSVNGLAYDISERKLAEEVLRERNKELNCHNAIADLIEYEDTLEKIYQGIVDIMPHSWFYKEIACARIILGEQEYATANFKATEWRQASAINLHGKPVGMVELCYLEERPVMDEGPFLKEERALIDVIAKRLARIVDRKLVEEELRESEERFQLAINAIETGIWEWDIQTNQEFFAPRWCEIIGYTFDDPELPHTYNSWAERIHPDDSERVTNALKNHLEKGTKYDVDYRHRHKSGEYHWQNSKGQAHFDESGKPIKMVGCISDITERKTLENERERLVAELQNSLDNVKILRGLVPICASCKKIRNDGGYWQQVEEYVAEHTDADFSHGLCEECAHKLYPDYFPDKKNEESK